MSRPPRLVTDHHLVGRIPLLALACAFVCLAVNTAPAFAAIDGSLVPSMASPGDWIQLTTVTYADPSVYASVAAGGPDPVFLQPADPASTGNACDTPVGSMTWTDGIGTLRFQVPEVSAGTYWILAMVQDECWRFGGGTGVLTPTVLPGGDRGASPVLLGSLGAIVVAVLIGGAMVLRRGGRSRG